MSVRIVRLNLEYLLHNNQRRRCHWLFSLILLYSVVKGEQHTWWPVLPDYECQPLKQHNVQEINPNPNLFININSLYFLNANTYWTHQASLEWIWPFAIVYHKQPLTLRRNEFKALKAQILFIGLDLLVKRKRTFQNIPVKIAGK